jgi:hypothetical protein
MISIPCRNLAPLISRRVNDSGSPRHLRPERKRASRYARQGHRGNSVCIQTLLGVQYKEAYTTNMSRISETQHPTRDAIRRHGLNRKH